VSSKRTARLGEHKADMVWLFGAERGIYVDSAKFDFHVPTSGLLWPSPFCGNVALANRSAKKASVVLVKARRLVAFRAVVLKGPPRVEGGAGLPRAVLN
jgi:hypothetical protein